MNFSDNLFKPSGREIIKRRDEHVYGSRLWSIILVSVRRTGSHFYLRKGGGGGRVEGNVGPGVPNSVPHEGNTCVTAPGVFELVPVDGIAHKGKSEEASQE